MTITTITTMIFAALLSFIATVSANKILDYLRNRKPKLDYEVKEAVPIRRGDKEIGAYQVYVTNSSSKTIERVSVKIRAENCTLEDGGITSTDGLNYTPTALADCLETVIPVMHTDEYISITVIAESSAHIPRKPTEFSIRSSKTSIGLTDLSKSVTQRPQYLNRLNRILLGVYAGVVAAISVGGGFAVATGALGFVPQAYVLVRAAETAGLQELTEKYATYDSLPYYPQALLAYSKARTARDLAEVGKYRDFLNLVLQYTQDRIPKVSKCAIHYYVAKIELLLNNPSTAYMHLGKAREVDGGHFQELMQHDPEVTRFLLQHEFPKPQAAP
jgi:hypothetical protein